MSEQKPCPFCGGIFTIGHVAKTFGEKPDNEIRATVTCRKCGGRASAEARTRVEAENAALTAWNTRPEDDTATLKARIADMEMEAEQASHEVCTQGKRIAELEAAQGWRPISTAPENEPCLIYLVNDNSGSSRVSVLLYWQFDEDAEEYAWMTTDDMSQIDHWNWTPTHWMPLPTKPE